MSKPRSGSRLRNEVHQELTELLSPGGRLERAPGDLVRVIQDSTVQAAIASLLLDHAEAPETARSMVITAGPPAAGKTSALQPMEAGFRLIDPDEIKTLLLGAAFDLGMLRASLPGPLADGRPVMAAELAGWVHMASTDIADLMRREALLLGDNIIMAGTLAWDGLVTTYIDELSSFDYEQLTILDVEVPREVAEGRARERWWQDRNAGADLGGRFIPRSAFDRYFPSSGEVSVRAGTARDLYAAAVAADFSTRMIVLAEDRAGNFQAASITPSGVDIYAGLGGAPLPLGAVCVQCGESLASKALIAQGFGPKCAAH